MSASANLNLNFSNLNIYIGVQSKDEEQDVRAEAESPAADQNILDEKLDRHCAFCLIPLSHKKVHLCGGCHRRAYCGRNCQREDWKGRGQGHKNWCSLNCGEEDLDWVVSKIPGHPGKGLGLIAKRMFPAKSRIMVDFARHYSHPGVRDLAPLDGTLEQKVKINCLGGSDAEAILCLRISRANHACLPNASHFVDDTFKVKILFAERDIQAGEEICINYAPFNDISKKGFYASDSRLMLEMKWGIVCPEDCFCRDEQIENVVNECKILDSNIFRHASSGDARAGLRDAKALIKNMDIIQGSLISRARTLYDAFQIAVMHKRTLNDAKEYIKEVYEIKSKICHPKSAENLRFEQFMKNPKHHHNYLRLD